MAITRRPLWAVDCETDPFDGITIPKPFIWGVFTGQDYYEFRDTDKLVDFLETKEVIVYAHNGGKFDWHFITHRLTANQKILFIAGRMARFVIGKCEFRDSMSLMPIPLSAYQKEEFDYLKMDEDLREKYMPEIQAYLESDCVNLWNLVNGFEKEYGRHLTQATAAMKIWTKKFGGPPQRTGPIFYDQFKPYYYGGRVQCFRSGDFEQRALGADINSAYPFAMTHPHPIGAAAESVSGPPDKRRNLGPMFLDVECTARGCFPYRDSRGATYYPADDVRRVYKITGWEFLAGIESGTIDPDYKIIRHVAFAETIDFKEYVKYFWDKRQAFKAADDWGGQYYCKIFLNSLYGKFGADPRRYRDNTIVSPDMLELLLEAKPDLDFHYFREWVVVREKLPERIGAKGYNKQRFYNVATAASITGFVRAMLWKAICKCTGPFYCDTDSITATGFGKAVTLGKELGQWEIEGHYDRVIIMGKKLYAFHDRQDGWKVRSKGTRLKPKDLIRLANGMEVTYHPEAPTFSQHSTGPIFIPRRVRRTAKDMTIVPPGLDPQNVTPITEGEAAP